MQEMVKGVLPSFNVSSGNSAASNMLCHIVTQFTIGYTSALLDCLALKTRLLGSESTNGSGEVCHD